MAYDMKESFPMYMLVSWYDWAIEYQNQDKGSPVFNFMWAFQVPQ